LFIFFSYKTYNYKKTNANIIQLLQTSLAINLQITSFMKVNLVTNNWPP